MSNKPEEFEPNALTVDLMQRMGATPAVAECCGRTVAAQDDGSICLGPLNSDLCQQLQSSPVIGNADSATSSPRPFILENQFLYTRRNWSYKQIILDRIANMKQNISSISVPDDGIFANMAERQRAGVEMMCKNQFSILTGGPGTGKTYTIARAVKLIEEQSAGLRLALAAPTGKAAARVREAMSREAENIGLAQALAATTIHTLLQSNYDLVTFKHNHDNPLPIDWLIVDEASMIDLPLMAKLLDALPPNARLTLVGDANQLASVQPGRVFGDLCKMPNIPKCELNVSKRFEAGGPIDQLANAINGGNVTAAMDILNKPDTCVHYIQLSNKTNPDQWPGFADLIKKKFATFSQQTEPNEALKRLNDCRLLCALREGPYGVNQLNEYMRKIMGKKSPIPVMILKNDHGLNVNNGDVGVIMPDEQQTETTVHPLYLLNEENQVRTVPLELLPDTETAFATTVHKSQGSEYQDVIIILPPTPRAHDDDPLNPLLTRELLYTAITRTKGDVYIYGGDPTIECCCNHNIQRTTGFNI